MSHVRQVSLLPAGCQPWNSDVCASHGNRFAYCATLAIYIYQYDMHYHEFRLHSIMSEHKKTITSISWHPKNQDILASASACQEILVWNISTQTVLARLENTKMTPCCVGWAPLERDSIAFTHGRGPLYLWNYTVAGAGLQVHKDAQSFSSDVVLFRWHPTVAGKLAFGHQDGSVSFFYPDFDRKDDERKLQRHVLRPEDSGEDDKVVALEWDPLSTEYLLLVNLQYGIRLVDTDTLNLIQRFQLPSAAAQIQAVSWVHSAPGMFLTGDASTGVMRLWNVSKASPLENIRLKKMGFHALQVFSTTVHTVSDFARKDDGDHNGELFPASPSNCRLPIKSTSNQFALPPAHALCTFMDGGVGLYNLGKRKWEFLRDEGHIETIFDCKFHPENPDLLATASFDGTVKIWNVSSMKCERSSPGNEGVIYCLSWAPADLNCIACSTSRNGVFIWDISKQKIIKRFHEHGKNAVYTVAWNHKDSRRIASCGADGFCIIRLVDGEILIKYKHPGAVYGGDWSPNSKDMIATGCEDKCVRVFYMATAASKPLKVFTGHSAKVFQVKWSPLRDGILCSGSDDGTIRVWDYTQGACINVLSGQKGPIRGLLWNPEIPYLLLSGSWDYSIRVWDTRDGACLDTILDHGADVYGLTSHPSRPFTVASCSRDSTVRILSLNRLVQPLEINILCGKPWSDMIASPGNKQSAMSAGTAPLLCGKGSRDIKIQLDNSKSKASNALELFSKLFSAPCGTENLWELVKVVSGMDDCQLSENYSKGIIHSKHITRFKAANARELEMVRMSKFGGGLGAPSREDRLREAAAIYIKLGNVQRYAELLVELGEWDKALAVAPSVSIKYWMELTERRTASLLQEGNSDIIPYATASGNGQVLVHYFTSRGQLQDAMVVAAAVNEGTIVPPTNLNENIQTNGVDSHEEEASLLKKTCQQLADWYFHSGSPVLSACCHLSVNDAKSAMEKLIRGHELELAISIGKKLGEEVTPLMHTALELLALRCEKLGTWHLAVDLLQQISNPTLALAKLCAKCASSMSEINELHKEAGFGDLEECLIEATQFDQDGDIFEAVKYYLMSSKPHLGLQKGLAYVKDVISSNNWTANDVEDLVHLMTCVRTDVLQQHNMESAKDDLLIIAAYIGGLIAVRQKYTSVVIPLFKHAKHLMAKSGVNFPLSESMIASQMSAWESCCEDAIKLRNETTIKHSEPELSQKSEIYENLLLRAGKARSAVGVGIDMVAGAHLPSHSDIHYSYLTGTRIQGPIFFLEDGQGVLSHSDALMWAKVNPMSPLGSGVRINPF